MKSAPRTSADTWAATHDPAGHRIRRPEEAEPGPVDRWDSSGTGRDHRSRGGGPAGRGPGDPSATGWASPPDGAPDRTAVAMARWQRRRVVRSLLGTPHGEIGPREGVRGAALCGCLLGVVLKVAVLTAGAWP